MTWEAIAAFTGIGLTVIGAFFYSVRKLTTMEFGILRAGQEREVTMVRAIDTAADKSRKEFGETVRAVKEHADLAHKRVDQMIIKIQEVELYVRDNYIEDPTFRDVIGSLRSDIKLLGEKLDKIIETEMIRLRNKD